MDQETAHIISVLLAPFVMVLFFGLVRWLAWRLHRFVPPGRLRNFLYWERRA